MKRFFLVLLALSLICFPACGESEADRGLTIDILELGKADCIVIQNQGERVMIDTGEEENLPEILAFLQQNRITKIDTLILSHFDKDHIGGAEGILQNVSVGKILQSNFSSDRPEFPRYQEEFEKQGKKPLLLTENYHFSLGDCHFTVMPPEKDAYDRKEDNNASMIVTLQYKDTSFGFFGDAMEERLEEFMASSSTSFDFAKLPYHGNHLDNYEDFLECINCKTAAICCSEKNPASEKTLSLLREKEMDCYLTQNGSIHITSDGVTVTVTQ